MPATEPRTGYSKKSWDTVASRMRGKQLSSHPILATLYGPAPWMTLQRSTASTHSQSATVSSSNRPARTTPALL